MDYRKYKMTRVDFLKMLFLSSGITILLAYAFYDDAKGCLLAPFIVAKTYRFIRTEMAKKQTQKMRKEFIESFQTVSSSLMAGLSLENAWLDAEKELDELHGEKSILLSEFHEMNQKVRLRKPVEESYYEFALRTDDEDILLLGEVLLFAKRTGGNLVQIIETSTEQIREKMELENEVDAMIAAKKMELQIMSCMPVAIILYLRLTSGDYLDVLYHNLWGIVIMTVSLFVYYLGFLWGKRLIKV